jgi:hypothetical protein
MIPPIVNDLRALAELTSHGVELELERARLSSASPLADALVSRMSFGSMGAETFVLYTNGRKQRALGVVQARHRKNRPEADITFIAPSLEHEPDAVTTWYRLLSEVTNSLGELGIQRIYAQLPVGNGAEEVFHQAGFTVFTREDIYVLDADKAVARGRANGGTRTGTLRRMRKRDAWNVLKLYSAVTPRNVQHAEAMLTTEGATGKLDDWWENVNGTSYVYERPLAGLDACAGIVRITRGRHGSWARLHVHPDALKYADEIVQEMIVLVSKTRARPIYVGVRDYEGGVRGALETAGFRQLMERSHMVKHTTVRVREAVPWLAPVFEKKNITAAPTLQHARKVAGTADRVAGRISRRKGVVA